MLHHLYTCSIPFVFYAFRLVVPPQVTAASCKLAPEADAPHQEKDGSLASPEVGQDEVAHVGGVLDPAPGGPDRLGTAGVQAGRRMDGGAGGRHADHVQGEEAP